MIKVTITFKSDKLVLDFMNSWIFENFLSPITQLDEFISIRIRHED